MILSYTIFYVQHLETIVFKNLSQRLKNRLYYYYMRIYINLEYALHYYCFALL